MIKKIMTQRVHHSLLRLIRQSFALANPEASSKPAAKGLKAYQVLLRNNIENSIKFPRPETLKMLRSRAITKIMVANHGITETEQVLEAHIECLFALTHRIEPSIEAISMFVDTVYTHIDQLRADGLTDPALLNLLKPNVLTKMVKVSHAIDPFYNQSYRSLISALVIRLMQTSVNNQAQNRSEMQKLIQEVASAKKGLKILKDDEGNQITKEYLERWAHHKAKEINQTWRVLSEIDYWTGFQFVLGMEYYTNDFLLNNISKLEKSLEKDMRTLSLPQLMVKIRSIVELHRFKDHKQVGAKGLRTLFLAYNKLIDQYFKVFSNQSNLLEFVSSEDPIIQTELLTTFLTPDHYAKAKKAYLELLKGALNYSSNGVLLTDIKRLRGLFEVVLILYGHEDTKEIHEVLGQLERMMMVYPIERFDSLEMHCYVCDKFGFKSDFFAEKFFRLLLQQQERLERNRGHIHPVHQLTREISLAQKFLLYPRIAAKLTREQLETANKLASSLFDPNIWYLLAESDPISESFLTASSFSNHLYFIRTNIQNLTAGSQARRNIDALCSDIGLRNLNRSHGQLIDELKHSNSRFTLKLDHLSNWRHNPYARMCNILELANHHHNYLQRRSPQDAANFIQQFLSKSLGSTIFYNTMKQRFAFPGILQNFIEIMEKANLKNFPIQTRDLETIKKLYQAQLVKIMKEHDRLPSLYYYQEHLDRVELNRVVIPSTQEVYGLPNIANCAGRSLLYQAARRFEKQKEYLRMQIETFLKFSQSGGIEVTVNYVQLPHLADLYITVKEESTVVLFRSYEGEPNHFLNYKHAEMQREAEQYWRKKGCVVYPVKCEKDLEEFMKKLTKQASVGRAN